MKDIMVSKLGELHVWTEQLLTVPEPLLHLPIAEGKWTINQIIAHLIGWDQYLIDVVFPRIEAEQRAYFPNHDRFNEWSLFMMEQYSPSELVPLLLVTRQRLIEACDQFTRHELSLPILINDNATHPQTGLTYTIRGLVRDFVRHDQHHFDQIDIFLRQHHIHITAKKISFK